MYNQNPILNLSTPEHFKGNIQKFLADLLNDPDLIIHNRTPAGESLQVLVTLCLMIEARIIESYKTKDREILNAFEKNNDRYRQMIIDKQIKGEENIDYRKAKPRTSFSHGVQLGPIRSKYDTMPKSFSYYGSMDDYISNRIGCKMLIVYKGTYKKTWNQVITSFASKYNLPNYDFFDVESTFSKEIGMEFDYFYYAEDQPQIDLLYDHLIDTETAISYPKLNTFESKIDQLFPIYNQEVICKNPNAHIFIVESNIDAKNFNINTRTKCDDKIKQDIIDSVDRYEKYITNMNKYLVDEYYRHRDDQKVRYNEILYTPLGDAKNAVNKMRFRTEHRYDKDVPVIFTSYIGEHPIFIPYSDWSCLQDHKVFYVLKRKDDYLEKMVNIHKTLSKFESDNIHYVIFDDNVTGIDPNDAGIEVLTTTEALVRANKMDICLTNLNLHEQAKIYQNRRSKKRDDFIVDDIIDRKSILLISAKSGVGKSLFALNLGYAVAQKGSLICDWKVTRQAKVLYVGDDELDNKTLRKHLEKFDKLYRCKENQCKENQCKENRKNFEYKQVRGFNLLTEEHRAEIHDYLNESLLNIEPKGNPVEILILDSLNKLCPGAETEAKWPNFYQWLRELQDDFNNLSVILIHHAPKSKDSRYSGTSKIENDVDVHIHLRRNSRKSTKETVYQKEVIPYLINVEKNRRAPLDLREHEYNLEWGTKPRWVSKYDDVLIWRGMEHEKKLELIIDYRKTKTAKEIGKIFNVSHKTIEKFVFENRDRIPTLQPGKRRVKK